MVKDRAFRSFRKSVRAKSADLTFHLAASMLTATAEVGMFARSVTVALKPNRVAEFTDIIETQILPLLRQQEGFRDEITLLLPEGLQAVGLSLWDRHEDAEAYNNAAYPQVPKALESVVRGAPEVHTFEVAHSTFHRIAACVAA